MIIETKVAVSFFLLGYSRAINHLNELDGK
jgi:hypothetical protein